MSLSKLFYYVCDMHMYLILYLKYIEQMPIDANLFLIHTENIVT